MWKEWIEQHRGTAAGIVCGLLLGFIYLFFGFWNMLIFAFIVFVGYYIGRKQDGRDMEIDLAWFGRWWDWLMQRWNMFR